MRIVAEVIASVSFLDALIVAALWRAGNMREKFCGSCDLCRMPQPRSLFTSGEGTK